MVCTATQAIGLRRCHPPVQAQENAATEAKAARAALQAAQEKVDSNEARAVEAEEKLAAETAARNEVDCKFAELQVCPVTNYHCQV